MKEISQNIIKPLRECLNLVFPPVMPLLIREASKPKPDLEELARLVSIDPGLTVTVLSLANSSYYSLSHKVTELKRAMIVLGSSEILKMAISVTLKKSLSLKMGKCEHIAFRNWSAMLWSAIASELLAKKVCPDKSDSIYLCALVKDLSLLLLCCSSDPRLKSFARLCRRNRQGIVFLGENQIQEEEEAWGLNHTRLTMELLDYWGFPRNECSMLADHHDLDSIVDSDPARQVLILGTYWSEVEMEEKNIDRLFRVRSIAKSIFGIEEDQFSKLRQTISRRFLALCQHLGISSDNTVNLYHDFPMSRIQDLYFAAQELQGVHGDLLEIVRTIVKHLYWLWGIRDFELSLLSPLTQELTAFTCTREHGIQVQPREKPASKNIPRSGIYFYLGDHGSIKLVQNLNEDELSELDLYTNFLAVNFENYYGRSLSTTSKARLMDLIPVAVARISSNGKILQVNQRFQEYFQLKHDPEGESFWSMMQKLVPLDRDDSWERFLNSAEEKYSKLFCPLEKRLEKDSAPCWHLAAHKVRIDSAVQIMAMLEDVKEISTLEKDILRQGEYLRGIISSMQDTVFSIDEKGTIVFSSPSFRQELLGKNFFQMAKPSSALTTGWGPEILGKIDMPVEVNMIVGSSGKSLELVFNRLGGTSSPQFLVVGRDLTTIRRMEEKIKKQATFDYLTKVYNRHQFSIFLERETLSFMRKGTGLGLVFVDLDRFKEFNDEHGHQMGDEALKSFARLLVKNSRKGMDYPCRFGGDEFVLLVTETDRNNLEQLARRLIRSFESQFKYDLNFSIGIAIMAEGESTENFLSRADKALFRAKKVRGNAYLWAADN